MLGPLDTLSPGPALTSHALSQDISAPCPPRVCLLSWTSGTAQAHAPCPRHPACLPWDSPGRRASHLGHLCSMRSDRPGPGLAQPGYVWRSSCLGHGAAPCGLGRPGSPQEVEGTDGLPPCSLLASSSAVTFKSKPQPSSAWQANSRRLAHAAAAAHRRQARAVAVGREPHAAATSCGPRYLLHKGEWLCPGSPQDPEGSVLHSHNHSVTFAL